MYTSASRRWCYYQKGKKGSTNEDKPNLFYMPYIHYVYLDEQNKNCLPLYPPSCLTPNRFSFSR